MRALRVAKGEAAAPTHSVKDVVPRPMVDLDNSLRFTASLSEEWCAKQVALSLFHYQAGRYDTALAVSDATYRVDAYRADNLLLLGAVHFQLRNFSESIFYSQQCIRVEPVCAEAFSNLGNSLKEVSVI
jgi:tetratricopeptide (TPR) repeat protein